MHRGVFIAFCVAIGAAVLALIGGGLAIAAFVRTNSDSSTSSSSSSTSAAHGSTSSSTPISSAGNCALGYAPTANDIQCDVAIIGAGPSGLYTGYRLAPVLGSKVCIIDERATIGGKVQAVEAPQSTASNRLYSPTHAEQVQSSHAQLRCLFQELGITTYARGGFSRRFKHYEFIDNKGYNMTNSCPECWTFSAEKLVAPNGDAVNGNLYASQANGGRERQGLPNVCGTDDYTTCSYGDNLVEELLRTSGGGLQAQDFAVFADFARHRFGSSEAANHYLGWTSGYGYVMLAREIPVDAKVGRDYIDYDWNGPSVGFYWPHNGPNMLWRKVVDRIQGNGSRVFLGEQAQCLDKATDSQKSTYPYVVRTAKRNVRAKRVVFGIPPGAFVESIKGTLGASIAANPKMGAIANRLEQCSIELFFPRKWWAPSRSVPLDSFCVDAACDNYTIVDTPGIRNYTEWIYYDAQNGYWLRYRPHPDIQQMNLLRMLPDYCQEMQATYLRSGLTGVTTRVMRYLRDTFEQTGLTVPTPLKVAYTFEPYAYARFNPNTGFSNADVLAFAAAPLGSGEKIALIAEGYDYMNNGWQHGAVLRAEAAFDTALSGLVSTSARGKWSQCRNADGDKLDLSNTNSLSNRCLLLNNEIDTAALAGIQYCPTAAATAASVSAHDGPHARDKGHRA